MWQDKYSDLSIINLPHLLLHPQAQNNHVVRSLTDGLADSCHHSVVYVGLCVSHPIECSWYSGQW